MTDSLRDKLRALADEWEQTANKLPPSIQGGVRLSHARELRALLDAEQDETADPEGQPEGSECCECFVTPEETWTRYGSAVEPGSQMEPNPDCRVHFPAAPAPVPDDEAVETLARLIHAAEGDEDGDAWETRTARAALAAGYVSPEAHAAAVREAVQAHGERIAEALQHAPAMDRLTLTAPTRATEYVKVSAAARIAREAASDER